MSLAPTVAGAHRGSVTLGAPRARTLARVVASGLLISATSLLMLPVGALTLFRARRLYSTIASALARAVLAIHGVRVVVHAAAPFPRTQTVYVSNHTSTLDLFLLVALRLPSTRFFLSGFLRKLPPLGIIATMMGTFFTVPQSRPADRARIFQRAGVSLFGSKATAVLTNVPGPSEPLYLAGKLVQEIFFWVPQAGRLGIGISIFSYNGDVRIGIGTDAGLVPDPERIVAAIDDELDDLLARAESHRAAAG